MFAFIPQGNHYKDEKKGFVCLFWRLCINNEAFNKVERKPIFINVGRGGTVCEKDLTEALDKGIISGAGLDVLEDENPNLMNNNLVGRHNVILTPHSAFYSKESMIKLQSLSAYNLAYTLMGELDKVNKILV